MRTERVTGGEPVERARDASSGPRLILSPRSVDEFRAKIAVGDILTGRVLDTLDGERAIVRFLDFNIVAQSETPLTRGETVRAEVTGIQDQVFMRLFPTGSPLERSAVLLAELGVPANRANLEVLALMERAGVPMTPDSLREVFNALQAAAEPERSAPVVVLAKSLNLPLTPATLEALETLTEAPSPLGARLAALTTELRAVLPTLAPGESARLGELEAFANALAVRPEDGNVREQVARFVNALGLGAENRAANGTAPEPSLKTALWAAQAEIALRIAETAARGANPALLESLRGSLDGLLRQLDAYQLLARIASPDLPNLYLQFAYWAGAPVPATLQMKARRHKPEVPSDDENADIEFSVRTERWGVVRARMAVREGVVTGRVEVETAEAQAFVAPRLRELAMRVADVGYRVQSLTSRVHGAPEEPVLSKPQLASRLALDLVV